MMNRKRIHLVMLSSLLKDVYERIEDCCQKQVSFLDFYTEAYGINKQNYMSIGFHPTTRNGNAQLHIERVIFSHIDYFNSYRMYLNSKGDFEKYDELNEIVLGYIKLYLELYKTYVLPISNNRNKIVESMEEKLRSGDKYISIEA